MDWDKERRAREEYFGDAVYEAYRRGLDVDRVDRDICDDHFWNGDQPESVADELQRRYQNKRAKRDYEDMLNSMPGYGNQENDE
jgi:hypothetical protein